jgi:putative oxidoreductase
MASERDGVLQSVGLLLLRVGTGSLLLLGHGWAKLIHASERAATFADPIGLGPVASFWLVVFAEAFCSLFVILGLATRLAAIPVVIFLTVAFFIQHAADPFPRKELALAYLVSFLTILCTGAGRFSLDASIGRRKK